MSRILFPIVVVSLLAILTLTLLYPQAMIAPGALIKGHAALGDDCFACHTMLLGSTPEKCIACHVLGRIGLFTTHGAPIEGKRVAFHQQLDEQDCMACHTDHSGLATAHGRNRFSHDLLRANLRGQCVSCHDKPVDRLHSGISGNCSACHATKAWTPADFDHDRYFRLQGEHDTECSTCHVLNDYHTFTCYGCNEHTSAGIRAEHLEEGIRDFENCVKCHQGAHEIEDGEGREKTIYLEPTRVEPTDE